MSLHDAFDIAKDPFLKEYAAYGIRRQEVAFGNIGDVISHTSFVWEDGEETEEELPGVCALWLDRYDGLESALNDSLMYYGNHVAIIASNSYQYGTDPNEIILEDPVIIATCTDFRTIGG